MQQERVQVDAALDIEEQRQDEQGDFQGALIQQRGDTINSLLNSRFVSLAVIAFVLGVAFNNSALIALSAFLTTTAFLAWLWSRNSLLGIRYERKFHHTHVFPGETTDVEIVVENRKWLPITWLNIEDIWPLGFAPSNENVLTELSGNQIEGSLDNAYSLRWYERVRRHYELKGRARGLYNIGPASITSGDPFSLFERLIITSRQRNDYLVVYPELLPIHDMGFPLHDPLGDKRVKRRLFEDPSRVIGIRDYQPQDTFRDIHWKATARMGELQSKIYEPTRGVNVVLALNIASFEQYWRGVWPEMLEYSISTTASVANWASEQHYSFGLICNGAYAKADQSIRVLPSRRPSQLKLVLEALAGVKYFVTKEFGRYVLDESARLPVGAIIVMVTPYLSDMMIASSMRLKRHGRQVVWLVVGQRPPQEVPGIPLYHMPIPLDEPNWDEGDLSSFDTEETREIERRLNAREQFLARRAESQGESSS